MIRSIRGQVHQTRDGSILVETTSGIGFQVFVPQGSPFYRLPEGEEACIYTSMVVKEDAISLYGFAEKGDVALFEMLLKVSGIGAKGAMSVLGALGVADFKKAVARGDAKAITVANGIGKKTAERLILELKDKVGSEFTRTESAPLPAGSPDDPRQQAILALVSLGYTMTEATAALSKVQTEETDVSGYIRQALKEL